MPGPQSGEPPAARNYRLTHGQQELLGWVAEGCPDGRYVGVTHRISVRALHSRGLVRISGRGPSWRCEITPFGRRQLNRPTPPPPRVGKPRDPERTRRPVPPRSTSSGASKTEQLVRDLVAAGGVLVVPSSEPDGTGVRQRAYAAQAAGKLPEGMALTTRTIGDRVELRLIPAREPTGERIALAETEPVPVPEVIDKLDPAAARFLQSTERHEVSRTSLERASRLVHAIAVEAKRRRWRVATPPRVPASRLWVNWKPAQDRHIWITASGVEFRIRVREEGVHHRGRHEGVQRAGAGSRLWDLYRKPAPEGDYDQDATGRLSLEMEGGRPFGERRRRSNWRDRADRRLEELLPELFAEFATRVIEDERAVEQARLDEIARQERVRQAALERERRWHDLMEKAKAQVAEDHRRRDLEQELADWEMSRRLEAFIEAAEDAYGEDQIAEEWLGWAKRLRERIDPLTSAPRLPPQTEPTREELGRYLPPGWNPYRP